MRITQNEHQILVDDLDYAGVTANPGGFVANNPLAIVTHTKLLEELIPVDTMPTEEVGER